MKRTLKALASFAGRLVRKRHYTPLESQAKALESQSRRPLPMLKMYWQDITGPKADWFEPVYWEVK